MTKATRRSVLRASMGMVAAGALARPFIANAAAMTATVWWTQGFAQEEDISFKKIVADYEKASGNTIDYTIVPFAPLRQKIVSAVTSGTVPDLFQNNPVETLALYAWEDKLVDVADVIETQKKHYTETALVTAQCYNSIKKRRGYYFVPYTCAVRPNHVWRPLVEKAGYKIEDAPKTWNAYYDFFKEVHKGLRGQGMRNVFGIGFQLNTTGNDSNALFDYFLIAYDGKGIVSEDGKLHADDPQVKEAAIKTVRYPTIAYKEGFVPPGAINWNDADDNNAFHAKQIAMDLDGTISTEVAIIKEQAGLRRHRHDGPSPRQRRQAGAERVAAYRRGYPEGCEERRGRQGLHEIPDSAADPQRVSENRTRPKHPVHAVDRQNRPVVAGRSASESVCRAGPGWADAAEFLGLQPGLRERREHPCLAHGLG
jgi:multiple sugar transport system substrate-binding protein